MKHHNIEKLVIAIAVVILTIAHYLTPDDQPLLHNVYRRLYYVPIIWASIRFGLKGGLLTSVAVSVLFYPHMIHKWGVIELQTTDAVFEIILYNTVAAVTGFLANAERTHRDNLEQANLALIRSNQMEHMGEIAAGMAHEIRNPLASLRGGIEILSKDATPKEERREVSGILIPEIERIDRAIKDFLSYARLAEPYMDVLDIGEVVSEVFLLLDKGGYHNVEFNIAVSKDVPKVNADRSQIRSVILNLVLNAVAAIEKKGKIELKVYGDGDDAIISVSDNGKGIAPENADKIFEPFFTTREKGLGLGLSIVKRIVDEHGGKIGFKSKPEEGTTFTVRLKGIRA
ncbi:MAG TPA: GHKL domain-containing protein [Firmicutes bacterium]|nr:GHKL domain-containing protein [Bacillota bacterium]